VKQKEVYDYLAKVYLDEASKRREPRPKRRPIFIYAYVGLSLILIAGLTIALFSLIRQKGAAKKDFALIIEPGLTRISFNFDLAKKETLSYNLDDLNLRNYKALGFFVRTANPKHELHLRIELRNRYGEKSEFYLSDISGRWYDFKVDLADFKDITNWSNMSELRFVIEDWNTRVKKGRVYIDNVRFVK
jgi:hypothetical protein